MDVSVGDKVQIRNGGIDVTNGGKAKAGSMYGEGGPLWAEVVAIQDGWNTGSRWGLPATVRKVRCSNKGVVVWQVRPEDIADNIIRKSQPAPTPAPQPSTPQPTVQAKAALAAPIDVIKQKPNIEIGPSNGPFAPEKGKDVWTDGGDSSSGGGQTSGGLKNVTSAYISDSMFSGDSNRQTPSYKRMDVDAKKAGSKAVSVQGPVYRAEYKTSWSNSGRRKEMLNKDKSLIQNEYGFPYRIGPRESMLADKYDYQIRPGDERYKSGPLKNMETELMNLRAALGIHVHGNNDIARSVKYYMYNRFKVPDTNLAHNRTFTHVFFTRPDLNLLTNSVKANTQTMNHTETALLWRRHPELFKLLTDYRRINDDNDFNMLLSNQVTSFNLQNESLSTIRAGRSWNEHEMVYGDSYTGRTAGEFTCAFNETSDYSVINLLKLWITYIDNVARGAWSPNYNFANCHVHDRALDYAAAVYVFKCGPDGEDVLYWSKYYGVFPIVTGADALNWELGSPVGEAPKLSINFAYSYKRDMSPISLLEFNNSANISGGVTWEPAFDTKKAAHCVRPYVGAPYIELDLGVPDMQANDVNRATKHTEIRLKFRKDGSPRRKDEILYKTNL